MAPLKARPSPGQSGQLSALEAYAELPGFFITAASRAFDAFSSAARIDSRRFFKSETLQKLETVAKNAGCRAVWLKMGTLQPEAIGLYQSAGYKHIACYGQYVDNPLSVCFEKELM